jgi:hypothetical protein
VGVSINTIPVTAERLMEALDKKKKSV